MRFKKLAALFLAVTLTVGICPLSAMAEEAVTETGCLDILSDTVYTFDGENIGDYGVVSNSEVNNTTSAETDATTYAGNRVEIAHETEDSDNKVLKLTQGNAGNGVTVQTWKGTTQSLFHLNFDIKKSGGDAGYFGITSYQGSRYVYLLRMYGKTIYLNNTEVYTYELDKWYNLDLQMDLEEHYAKLTITDETGNIKTIDLPYERTFTNKILEADRPQIGNFYFGWVAGNASGGTVYIDNYMQNTGSDLTPTLNSHNDTFDTMPIYDDSYSLNGTEKGVKTVGARTGWYGKGIYGSSESDLKTTVSVENGKLKIATAEGSRFPMLIKAPFYSAPAVKHRIRFKMSGVQNETKKSQGFWVDFTATATAGITKEKQVAIQMDPGKLKLGNTTFSGFNWDSDYMYPCEFIYDAADKVAVITLVDKDGTQYSVDWSVALQTAFGTDAAWGNLYQLRYRLASGTDGNAVTYIDDFQWDILDVAPVTTQVSIASGSGGAASLDETVVIDYDRPVSYEKSCIGDDPAKVTVESDGRTVDVQYTLSVLNGKQLLVNLKGLKPQKSYTVTVSDVKLMEDDVATDTVSTTFTTGETSVGVTDIYLNDKDVLADVISGYAGGTDVTLAAKQYTGGDLGEIRTGYASVKRNYPETISLHTPFSQTADSTEVFVWSDFKNMIPYCAKEVLGTQLSTATPTVSGDSIIDSISVDDGADTLAVKGTLPQNAEKWVTVEVLQPGYYWTAADAVAAGYSAENSLEAYEEGTDDIRSYLAYFGQLDNKAGQPYSFIAQNYTQSDASTLEFRMRLGDGNYFYYSSRILDLINSAPDGDTMKTIVEGFTFLAEETTAERAYLALDEEPHFWTNMVSYRNSLAGGRFAELFEVIDIADDIVRLTKLKLAENETDLTEVLDLCTDYGVDDYNSYDLYKGINKFKLSEGACLNATQKAALVSNLLGKKNTYTTVEAFTADFNANAVLYAASGADSKNLVLHLLKNADILSGKLGTFSSCGNTKQLSVSDTINKKSVYASIDALGSDVTTLSAAPDGGQQGGELEPEGGEGSAGSVSGGTTGGGGGGGGGNNKDKETAVDKEKEDETATDKKEENEKASFTDLDEVEWAQEAIYALREKGIVSGRSDESFDPLATVTREEFAKMLVLAVGCYDESATTDFSDVSASEWSYSYIASAAKKGLINGIGDGKFGVGGVISRQDMALLIARAAGFTESEKESSFADNDAISDYARSAVAFVSEQGMMNGVGDNSFAPHMQVTRAQAAKVIYELIQRG